MGSKDDTDAYHKEEVDVGCVTRIRATPTQVWSTGVALVIATVFLWTMKADQMSMREDINKIQAQSAEISRMVYEVYYQRSHISSVSTVNRPNP